MSEKQAIIIFKAVSEIKNSHVDNLLERSFDVVYISPLNFDFKNLDELRQKVQHPEDYSGMILSSPRCVQAIKKALADTPLPAAWMQLHNYAVGETTHNLAMNELQQLFTQGKETGNSAKLVDFIIETCNYDKSLPFLLPCGNLAKDTMQVKLKEAGFRIDAIEIYETTCSNSLAQDLDLALKSKNVKFMVFFSPSGVNFVYDYFKTNNKSWDEYNLVAIGPSTSQALENKNAKVYATAKYPSIEHILEILYPKKQEEALKVLV